MDRKDGKGRIGLVQVAAAALLLIGVVTAANFPYDVGPPNEADLEGDSAEYYEDSYATTAGGEDKSYVLVAREAAHQFRVADGLQDFIERYELSGARALEVGAGSGTLQDQVEDYTGLDIAENARRFFHKPFVAGSATDLPFDDNSFDLIWTIWTLEHVPDPESALVEMRRVVRNGGYLYLQPAWNNPTWASEPFVGVPFKRLRLIDKLRATAIRATDNWFYLAAHTYPTRALRRLTASLSPPTRLRYRGMTPNYNAYEVSDADAVNSVDCYEARLWFESRGDNVLDEGTAVFGFWDPCFSALVIEVRKNQTSP